MGAVVWSALAVRQDPSGATALQGLLDSATSGPILRAALILLVGVPLVFALSKWLRRFVTKRHDAQAALVASKLTFYPLLLILLVSVLRELGFSLAPLLGAAGILGIALGFASQTSVSNIISGFFLVGERPFEIGDVIQVGGTMGVVLSVDMLSVKLRTFDNRFVRIPNEVLIKTEVINNTRFPIRRFEVPVGIAYREDTERAAELLRAVADEHPLCLMDPEPVIFHDGFGDSGVNLRLAAWTRTSHFMDVKRAVSHEVKRRLDEAGIEIPFPHLSLYAGLGTEPIPVVVRSPSEAGPEAAESEEGPPAGASDAAPAGEGEEAS